MYVDGPQLHFGTLDASGNYTASAGSPITITPSMGMLSIASDSVNNLVNLFYSGTGSTIKLYTSTSAYNAFNNTTTFTDITPTSLSASYDYRAMNIGPMADCLLQVLTHRVLLQNVWNLPMMILHGQV